MAFGQRSWDAPLYDENKVWKFWMKQGQSKRIMIFCNEKTPNGEPDEVAPFLVYEHNIYKLNGSRDPILCLKRNELGETCPICEYQEEMYPTLTGYFTIIELGDIHIENGEEVLKGYVNNEGREYRFQKRLLGAKQGSRQKPGILRRVLFAESARRKGLNGCIFDVSRSGSKSESIGDTWTFVEKVKREDWPDYFESLGAGEKDIDFTEIDYLDYFKPLSIEAMNNIVRGSSGNENGSNGWQQKSSFNSDRDESDIPF